MSTLPPPPTHQRSSSRCHSFLNHCVVKTSPQRWPAQLCVVFTSVEFTGFFFGDILCWNHISVNLPSFSLARLVRMSCEQRLCPGNGGKKCGAFMSPLFRDLHPTCARCRGQRCSDDMTCDICKDWSVTQWEKYHCKRSYSERRKNRPPGSILLPSKTSPTVPPASTETWPPVSLSLPLPLPPPSEGRGIAGKVLGVSRAYSSPSSCARSRGEGGGGASAVAGSGAVSADSSLMGGRGSAAIPPSQPSPVLARSTPVPGPSGLLVFTQPGGIA